MAARSASAPPGSGSAQVAASASRPASSSPGWRVAASAPRRYPPVSRRSASSSSFTLLLPARRGSSPPPSTAAAAVRFSLRGPDEVTQERGEAPVGAGRAGLDGPDGHTQLVGDLTVSESAQVSQPDHVPLVGRELLDRGAHLPRLPRAGEGKRLDRQLVADLGGHGRPGFAAM